MYRQDDYMVMDGDTAALSNDSPQSKGKYQRELAAVFNTIQSQERLVDLMSIEGGVDGTLLSLLCTLLSTSVIGGPIRTKHYSYYLQVHGSRKVLPTTYLMDRLNSDECVWGFPYGSLGYPMYLYPTTYMHPSRMVKVCVDHYLRGGGSTLDSYMEPLQEVISNVEVFSTNLPLIADWYLGQGCQYSVVSDMEGKAYTTISNISKAWLRSGLCPITTKDVLHLTLPPQWRALYEELVYVRRASEWVPSDSTGTVVEELLSPLMSISPLSDPQGLRGAMSYVLGICAPGGWDLLLVVLAAQLINKLYVVAHGDPNPMPPGMGEVLTLLEQVHSPTMRVLVKVVKELNDAKE